MQLVTHLVNLVIALAAERQRLVLDNVALKQQLIVLKRSPTRAKLDDSDRVFWVLLSRLFKDWAKHLVIVEPETAIRWYRKGFAFYWRRRDDDEKPQHRGGREGQVAAGGRARIPQAGKSDSRTVSRPRRPSQTDLDHNVLGERRQSMTRPRVSLGRKMCKILVPIGNPVFTEV